MSTLWVVSLNTTLSPSPCVVIQEEECNHTLGSLTPLDLVPHPVSNPRSCISSQVLVWLWHGLQSGRTTTQDRLGTLHTSFEVLLEPRTDFHTDPPQIGDSLD